MGDFPTFHVFSLCSSAACFFLAGIFVGQNRGTWVLPETAVQMASENIRQNKQTTWNHEAATKSTEMPDVIIQWGRHRTATTLQFQGLCVALLLVHGEHPKKVRCEFRHPELIGDEDVFPVLKFHYVDHFSQQFHELTSDRRVWIFATAEDHEAARNVTREVRQKLDMPVKYIQLASKVAMRSYTILTDLQPVFGLTDEQTRQLLEYMKYWSMLRQCCGVQMSADYREALTGAVDSIKSAYSFSSPACDIYNVAHVESKLMATDVWKKYSKHGPANIRSPSVKDGEFTGSYCAWINRQIACQRLGFNRFPKVGEDC
eukprot:CAMPEP_0197632418 /NCGR_PEP_ID=MMETSP1338-20131121/9179_1 /TAXON_ID=43686 ORGANISM="Pelagodinium beii, Strain RCC1491" /NCGR_SAMPLE_ID=MMETSP1338 /ASSEMBLY_ACC=CAM_ASM_000754 /LENGTH=315 /DNA_ID=CAMNT_0043203983 /DNA_START=50 /DNA_END=997 /DNA_ORIENTATION=-